MNIVLIGLRGSGKSKLGRLMSAELEWDFFDTDKLIEEGTGQTIQTIVAKGGWDVFRALESQAVKSLEAKNHAVIATGGGVPLDAKNIESLKKNGFIVLMHGPIELLAARALHEGNRPPLTDKNPVEEMKHLWNERREVYMKAAAMTFEIEDAEAEHNARRLKKQILAVSPHVIA